MKNHDEPDTVPGQLPDSRLIESAGRYKLFENMTGDQHMPPPEADLDPPGSKPATPVKHDNLKTDWNLVPMEAVEEIARVLEFGARKYSANNWRSGSGFAWTRVFNSLLRHLFAWVRGEDLDPESGLSHLAHAGCNVLFLIYYSQNKDRFINDDRFKK